MDQSFTVSFDPSAEDYTRNIRTHTYSDRRGMILAGMAAIVAMYLANALIQGAVIHPLVWVFFGFMAVALLTIYVINPASIGRKMAQNERLAAKQTWLISPQGIDIHTRMDHNVMEWYSFRRLVETKTDFLLVSAANPRAFQFIPKRAFERPEQMDAFRRMAGARLTRQRQASR